MGLEIIARSVICQRRFGFFKELREYGGRDGFLSGAGLPKGFGL
jgi:hypothetical protein